MQTPTYLLIGQVHRFLIFLVHTDPFVGLPLPDYRPGFVQEHELLKVITCQARSSCIQNEVAGDSIGVAGNIGIPAIDP